MSRATCSTGLHCGTGGARERVLDLYSVHVFYHVLHALAQKVVVRVDMRLQTEGADRWGQHVGAG